MKERKDCVNKIFYSVKSEMKYIIKIIKITIINPKKTKCQQNKNNATKINTKGLCLSVWRNQQSVLGFSPVPCCFYPACRPHSLPPAAPGWSGVESLAAEAADAVGGGRGGGCLLASFAGEGFFHGWWFWGFLIEVCMCRYWA